MNIIDILKSRITKTAHLVLKNGENHDAGIKSINDNDNTVTYMHGQGLWKLKDAQNKGLPEKPILDDPNNYRTISIDDIASVT